MLLINPPRFNELIGKNPAIVEKHRGFNPPLGLLCLAGYLEEHSDCQVEVIDTQPHGWDYDRLAQEIRQRDFDVCGITAMTFTLIDVRKTCQVVRREKPNAKIVLGGAHVHLFPDETIAWPEVDFLIQGEGEIAFVDFLEKLDQPDLWPTVPGIVYQKATVRSSTAAWRPAPRSWTCSAFPPAKSSTRPCTPRCWGATTWSRLCSPAVAVPSAAPFATGPSRR
jgi:radical SAM superfamily enzyme YgiQ (UPF0313 family)